MIDEKHVETFERDGVLILPQVLPQDVVKQLENEADKWIASDHQDMRQAMSECSDGFRNAIALNPLFVQLLAWPSVLPYLVRLLGPDIHLLTSHIIYRDKLPDGAPHKCSPGWHRDFAKAQRTLGDDRIQRLDMKVAFCLNDLPTENRGGTMFVPGSHKLKKPLEFEPGTNPPGYIEPTVRAGDAILFENRTWHAGGINLSNQTRKVIMFGFTYVWIKPSDYEKQSPETLAEAQRLYGDVGLQLLGGLERPVHFDYDYDSQPLRDWQETRESALA